MEDIQDLSDIKVFVDGFYAKVREDELLEPVFSSKIAPDEWQLHLNRMYGFWHAVLFYEHAYQGNPFTKHASLPLTPQHFERWLLLFTETIDENFQGPHAEDAKMKAGRIASVFQGKLGTLNPAFASADDSGFRQ